MDAKGEENEQIKKWHMRKELEALNAYSGNGTSMITLNIPPREMVK